MKVILPAVIEPLEAFAGTNLTSAVSNFSVGTTYAAGARVSYAYRIYESLVSSNTGNYPPWNDDFSIDPPASAFWVFVGPDNRAAMFDSKGNTSSTATTSFYSRWFFGNRPGDLERYRLNINTIAVLGVNAITVRLVIRDNSVSGTILYDVTKGLADVYIGDWYDYFFLPTSTTISQIVFEDIPANPTPITNLNYAELIVTGITGATVSVSSVICGNLYSLGDTQYGISSGIIDYSKKDTDEYGNVKLTKRAYSKKVSGKVKIDNSDLNRVQSIMYKLRATPCVWIGSDAAELQEALIIYGFYNDFSTEIAYPTCSLMNLDIIGLT